MRSGAWNALGIVAVSCVALVLAGEPRSAPAQTSELLDSTGRRLDEAQRAELGDPLHRFVLKDHLGVVDLAQIIQLLQPREDLRQTFVVDERILDSTRPQNRRAVLTFKGFREGLQLDGNVALSVTFNSEVFQTENPPFIEAWGWDEARGVYNYYRLGRRRGGDILHWTFEGSSRNADILSLSDRTTCFRCHINGAPVMKELFLPWNNWHSASDPASYLVGEANAWPVASHPLIGRQLEMAEALQLGIIVPSIKNFSAARVKVSERSAPDGQVEIPDARRLLKPLFETTEFNIITSDRLSGLHPFDPLLNAGPRGDVQIPNGFFLNSALIGGGGPPGLTGLGIEEALGFRVIATVTAVEYKDLVTSSNLCLAGRSPGDARFAWITPEPSLVDNALVDALIRRGTVTREFVAAALAVDLETPILSEPRKSLQRFLPEKFRFQVVPNPVTTRRHPDQLTTEVIAALEAAGPAPGTPAFDFLNVLKNDNPVAVLRQRVIAYRDWADGKLKAEDQARRRETLQLLFRRTMDRRQAVLKHETMTNLDETDGKLLFPAVCP
jgi:hypothetical protein